MWMLFKSEIDYAKYVLLGFYLFALPFFIWNAFSGRAFRPSLQVMIFCVSVCCSILGSHESKNKSIRIKRVLPLSFISASFFRLTFIVMLTLVYSGSIYIAERVRAGALAHDHKILLLQISAGLLIFLSAATILADLRYTVIGRLFQKAHPILLPMMILAVIIIYALTFNDWQISQHFQNQFYTMETAMRMVVLAIFALGLSVITYFSRTSFVE